MSDGSRWWRDSWFGASTACSLLVSTEVLVESFVDGRLEMAYSVGFSARDVRSLSGLLALLGGHSGLSVVCVNGTIGPIPNMTKRLLVLGRRGSMAIVQKIAVVCARDECTEEGAGLRVVALQTRRCRRGAAPSGSGSESKDDFDLEKGLSTVPHET
jgi:hypothetical protein